MFSDNNAIYLITAYCVFIGGILSYLISLILRTANVKRDEREIAEYEKETH